MFAVDSINALLVSKMKGRSSFIALSFWFLIPVAGKTLRYNIVAYGYCAINDAYNVDTWNGHFGCGHLYQTRMIDYGDGGIGSGDVGND